MIDGKQGCQPTEEMEGWAEGGKGYDVMCVSTGIYDALFQKRQTEKEWILILKEYASYPTVNAAARNVETDIIVLTVGLNFACAHSRCLDRPAV